MINYTDPRILPALNNGGYDLFQFVEILLTEPTFDPIYITDYPDDITIGGDYYSASVLKAVERPPRSGNLTQEVQKLSIAQGLSSRFQDTTFDFIRLLGNNYHNAPVIITSYMQIGTDLILEPLLRSEGLVKGVSRSAKNSEAILEFSNAFGRLDMFKELRTTTGSLGRYNQNDTSFDRASSTASTRTVDWGTKPGGEN